MNEHDAERGWIEIPGLLSVDECTDIVDACERICADPNDRRHRDKPVSGTIHLEELDDRIPLVGDLLERPALRDAVASWFGVELPPTPSKVSLRMPNPGHGEQDMHRDTIEGPPQPIPDVVTAIVALIDFREGNGATRFIPGSHRTSLAAVNFRGRRQSPDEVVLTGQAGTAFVFSGHALHRSGQNTSSEPRPALQISWNRSA